MSYFIRNGNTFRVADKASVDLSEHLPVGNYIVKEDMFKNLYLEMVDSFEHKGKVYGNTPKLADRILNTFVDRPASTGVMLTGEKGSGKTLLARLLSMQGSKQDLATIIINNPYCGDTFNKLIQDIDQPAIVLFDEFEKVYDRDQQESILTLLDGVFPTKKLFVITCNDKYRVDQHMRNRPGRIYYMLDFKGLENSFIEEYCKDNLKNKKHIKDVCKISSIFEQFNFDMLKALIEEMNRYNESPQESLKMLNAKPEFGDQGKYEVELIVDNKRVEDKNLSPNTWKGNPLGGDIEISFHDGSKDNDGDGHWDEINLTNADLQKIEPQHGRFVFTNHKGTLILTREKTKTYDFYGAF